MAQRKKTPKYLADLIQAHSNFVDYAEERIRAKSLPLDNQNPVIQSLTVEEIVGQASGYMVALEAALMAYGCYAGFMYVGMQKRQYDADSKSWSVSRESVGPDHAEFREWARTYFTRT